MTGRYFLHEGQPKYTRHYTQRHVYSCVLPAAAAAAELPKEQKTEKETTLKGKGKAGAEKRLSMDHNVTKH